MYYLQGAGGKKVNLLRAALTGYRVVHPYTRHTAGPPLAMSKLNHAIGPYGYRPLLTFIVQKPPNIGITVRLCRVLSG